MLVMCVRVDAGLFDFVSIHIYDCSLRFILLQLFVFQRDGLDDIQFVDDL